MFKNSRYVTRGVTSDIPVELQFVLWMMVDSLKIEKDYLQVFKLTNEEGKQKIVHSQEEPDYKKEYVINKPDWEPVVTKVYIIDDGDHSTMLLAEEY